MSHAYILQSTLYRYAKYHVWFGLCEFLNIVSIVLSMGQLEKVPDDPVGTESWDISSAFLQGLKYTAHHEDGSQARL